MVVLLSEDIYDFDLDVALQSIPEQRRLYALRYQQERDRRLSVKAYLLLCQGLREKYGICEMPLFNYTQNGKPLLQGYPNIHFNISHCNHAVICVIDNHPIGVDIESIKEYDAELLPHTMNLEEQEQIRHAANPAIEFTRLWTMKEAVLKLTGKGITNTLTQILCNNSCTITTRLSPSKQYIYSICK